MTNISVTELNVLKNCSTLVSLPINLSIKMGFVFVNGYLLRIIATYIQGVKNYVYNVSGMIEEVITNRFFI